MLERSRASWSACTGSPRSYAPAARRARRRLGARSRGSTQVKTCGSVTWRGRERACQGTIQGESQGGRECEREMQKGGEGDLQRGERWVDAHLCLKGAPGGRSWSWTWSWTVVDAVVDAVVDVGVVVFVGRSVADLVLGGGLATKLDQDRGDVDASQSDSEAEDSQAGRLPERAPAGCLCLQACRWSRSVAS